MTVATAEARSSNATPVRTGVAEVLRHALKVDFWDVGEIANKIVGLLRHPPLVEVLRDNAFAETLHLTWERAARGCLKTYTRLTGI